MASGFGDSGWGAGWGAGWLSAPTQHGKTQKAATFQGKP